MSRNEGMISLAIVDFPGLNDEYVDRPNYRIPTPLLNSHLLLEMHMGYFQNSVQVLKNILGNLVGNEHKQSFDVIENIDRIFHAIYESSIKSLVRKSVWVSGIVHQMNCLDEKTACDVCTSISDRIANIKCCNKKICCNCVAKAYWESTKSLTLVDSKCIYCRKRFHIHSLCRGGRE